MRNLNTKAMIFKILFICFAKKNIRFNKIHIAKSPKKCLFSKKSWFLFSYSSIAKRAVLLGGRTQLDVKLQNANWQHIAICKLAVCIKSILSGTFNFIWIFFTMVHSAWLQYMYFAFTNLHNCMFCDCWTYGKY